MRKKLIVILILSILLLLAVALAVVVYAQGPGGGRVKEGGGMIGQGLADPPPAGYTVLYTFSGARDNRYSPPNTAATAVHCTNAGTAAVTVRVEISDYDNAPTVTGTVALPPSWTGTVASQDTAFYDEDTVIPAFTDDINQGSGRILVNPSSAKVICTAQVLDPINNPPNYAVQLTLYDSSGNLVGRGGSKSYLPAILKQ